MHAVYIHVHVYNIVKLTSPRSERVGIIRHMHAPGSWRGRGGPLWVADGNAQRRLAARSWGPGVGSRWMWGHRCSNVSITGSAAPPSAQATTASRPTPFARAVLWKRGHGVLRAAAMLSTPRRAQAAVLHLRLTSGWGPSQGAEGKEQAEATSEQLRIKKEDL